MTPFQAYQFAQRTAQRAIQIYGTSAIVPARRTTSGWWTPMFPTVYLPAKKCILRRPRASRNG